VSAEVRPPITRLAAQQPFNRRTSQQTEEIAMGSTHSNVNRLRQLKVVSFLASWRCYPGNLGYVRFFSTNRSCADDVRYRG
jgi:hypothetical protein